VVKELAADIEHARGAGSVIPVMGDRGNSTDEVTPELSSIEQSAGGEGGKR
jgi:hypothetical protein